MSCTMNGQANGLYGHTSQDFSSCGVEVDNVAGRDSIDSKTSSPPTKRAFEAGPGEDQDFPAPAPKKARLSSPPPPQPQPYHLSQDEGLALDLDPGLEQGFDPGSDLEESIELDADDQEQPTPPRYPAGDLFPEHHRVFDPYSWLGAFVFQWLETVGSSSRKHKRSRSWYSDGSFDHLNQKATSDSQPIPQSISQPTPQPRRPCSAPPDMDRRDNDGFAVPLTPSSYSGGKAPSIGAQSFDRRSRDQGSAGSRSDTRSPSPSGRPVEKPMYRDITLCQNRIILRDNWSSMPGHVGALVDKMRRGRTSSPGPSEADVRNNSAFNALISGCPSEKEVEMHYSATIFPSGDMVSPLRAVHGQSINPQMVPMLAGVAAGQGGDPTAPRYTYPKPDLMYGYHPRSAFANNPKHQRRLTTEINSVAASPNVVLPFFLVEFKGFNNGTGVATNQCMGGTAACINISETLNLRLKEFASDKHSSYSAFDTTMFSVAMDASQAWVFVSWKEDGYYYTRIIEGLNLYGPDHYIKFRRIVRNIIEWGMGERLDSVKRSLDRIEAGIQAQAQAQAQAARDAKSRERSPGSIAGGNGSGSVSGKKQRM